MDDSTSAMMKYCKGMADEFDARLSRMRAFVSHHNLTHGNANESILREFLTNHAPGKIEVAQGFLCEPFKPDCASRQCDILIHNRNDYPLIHSDGPIKVVWPESVRMVIESKTTLTTAELINAMDNLNSVKVMNWRVPVVLFAFTSCTVSTVVKHLKNYPPYPTTGGGYFDSKLSSVVIILFDKKVIIHNNPYLQHRYDYRLQEQPTEYTVTHCHDKDYVVVYLLIQFLMAVQHLVDEAGLINILKELSRHHTDIEKEADFFQIGQDYDPSRPTSKRRKIVSKVSEEGPG